MAYRAGLTTAALVLVALARPARAEEPCELERWRMGLVVAPADAGLSVTAVDDGSAGASGGLRAGDAVMQVNGVVPRSCADWARALRDARRERKAVLLLVRRPDGDVPLAVAASAWDRAAAPGAPRGAAVMPAEPPSVAQLVTAAPPSIPPGAQPTLGEVMHDLAALGGPAARLVAYGTDVARVHAAVRGLRAVPEGVVSGLETVLRYHDAALVAWQAEEATRERERRPRRLPTPEAMVAPYFLDSDEDATIEAFPFLRDTVTRRPTSGMVGESAGLWRPVEARKLLWERARAEQDRLATWLGMAGM